MFDPEALRQVERLCQFDYPPAFWQRYKEFAALAATEPFRAGYSSARLIGACDELRAVRQSDPDLPDDFIPFLIPEGPPYPDYYGFVASRPAAPTGDELPVVVWRIHAYVHQWDAGFGAFLDEVQRQCRAAS